MFYLTQLKKNKTAVCVDHLWDARLWLHIVSALVIRRNGFWLDLVMHCLSFSFFDVEALLAVSSDWCSLKNWSFIYYDLELSNSFRLIFVSVVMETVSSPATESSYFEAIIGWIVLVLLFSLDSQMCRLSWCCSQKTLKNKTIVCSDVGMNICLHVFFWCSFLFCWFVVGDSPFLVIQWCCFVIALLYVSVNLWSWLYCDDFYFTPFYHLLFNFLLLCTAYFPLDYDMKIPIIRDEVDDVGHVPCTEIARGWTLDYWPLTHAWASSV
jgi:hypothetical protein